MNRRIQQLPTAVANQIAAGEVIERPASVVKELLENALDAEANALHIEIDFGGLNQIKVSDNGMGIDANDLPLAIAAHATSKITQLTDLYTIYSMGFRGEALASIASVSRLSISSKPKAQPHAMKIQIENSAVTLLPCARVQGTTVEVCDLFFNAPVRKKFLKSEAREYQMIENVIKRFALSAMGLSITLKHNGKQMLALPAATCEKSKLNRIQKLLGKTFIEQAIYLDVERAGMRLQGWIGGPDDQRSQNDKQWIYINRRMVKDKLIHHAVKQGYESVLHPGRYPTCLLYLTMPGDELDVNVHPTKHEVRFQQPRLVHDLISSQIVQALTSQSSKLAPMFLDIKKLETAAELRESYVKKPLSAIQPFSINNESWTILNIHFALIKIADQPYLVDVGRLQYERLKYGLEKATLPLKKRPLLVPVSFDILKTCDHIVDLYQSSLAELGVELDRISDTKIMVRTVPLMIPQLNIKQLIEQLSKKKNLEKLALFKLLADCQTFDAYQLTQDEQQELIVYFHHQLSLHLAKKPYLRLDLNQCQELLRMENMHA